MQISIYRNFSKKVMDKILESQLDFGIVTLPVPDRDLHVMPIAEDELWLIASPRHPLAERGSIQLRTLSLIPSFFTKPDTTRERLMKHFGPLWDKMNISMELASIETIKKFVSIGMGISIVPKSYVSEETEQRYSSHLVRIKNFKLIRKLGLDLSKNRYMSRASKAFLEVVENSLGN